MGNLSVDIPVFHINRRGGKISHDQVSSEEFGRSYPCVEIGFTYQDDLWHGTTRTVQFRKVCALIDTGADAVFVDQSLVDQFDCPPAKGGQNMMINNAPSAPAREGQIFVLEASHTLKLWVLPRDFRGEGAPFQMILGRRFLQMCTLTWIGPNRKATLTWHGTAGAW